MSKVNRATYKNNANTRYHDNTSGDIEPHDNRNQHNDAGDSFFVLIDDAYSGATGLSPDPNVTGINTFKQLLTDKIPVGALAFFMDSDGRHNLRVYKMLNGPPAVVADIGTWQILPNDYDSTGKFWWQLTLDDDQKNIHSSTSDIDLDLQQKGETYFFTADDIVEPKTWTLSNSTYNCRFTLRLNITALPSDQTFPVTFLIPKFLRGSGANIWSPGDTGKYDLIATHDILHDEWLVQISGPY